MHSVKDGKRTGKNTRKNGSENSLVKNEGWTQRRAGLSLGVLQTGFFYLKSTAASS